VNVLTLDEVRAEIDATFLRCAVVGRLGFRIVAIVDLGDPPECHPWIGIDPNVPTRYEVGDDVTMRWTDTLEEAYEIALQLCSALPNGDDVEPVRRHELMRRWLFKT